MLSNRQLPLLLTTLFLFLNTESIAFQCYVCDSKNDIECVETIPDDTRLKPQSCQNITGAKYCIKTTNIFAGKSSCWTAIKASAVRLRVTLIKFENLINVKYLSYARQVNWGRNVSVRRTITEITADM